METAARPEPVDILVVDDRPENLFAIEMVLDSPDYRIVTAGSGAEAIEHVRSRDFALVLLDVQMPSMDGFETARHLVRESLSPVPILMVTALDRDENHTVQAYSEGAIDFIYKPIDNDILRSKVARFAQMKRATRAAQLLAQEQTARFREVSGLNRTLQAVLESVLDAVPVGIVIFDATGTPKLSNRGFRELAGPDPIPSLDRWIETYRLADADGAPLTGADLPPLATLKDGQDRRGIEVTMKRPGSDASAALLMDTRAVRDETGAVIEVTASLVDVGPLKLLQARAEQAERFRSLGLLAGGIAHDFNNLLAVMMGNVDLVLDELPDPSPMRAYLEPVLQAGDAGRELTNQLLNYARRSETSLTLCSLDEMMDGVSRLLRITIPPSIQFQTRLSPAPHHAQMDTGQMRQVLMNLIRNAVDAIGTQEGTITLRTGILDLDEKLLGSAMTGGTATTGRHAYFEVADTGCGMDPETARRIFDPFYSTKFVGRGLGLANVLGIVTGHRGAILIDSAPGRGSSFKILLPEVSPSSATPSAPSPELAKPAKLRVLIIEDIEEVREYVVRVLERLGLDVVSACDGEEGLEVFRSRTDIDLVITDLSMPRRDGLETMRELHRIKEDLPVVLMTGLAEDAAFRRMEKEGFSAILAKPFTLSHIKHILSPILERLSKP